MLVFHRTSGRFATVHRSMSRDEMLLEYLKTTKTGTYLIPPGVGETGFVGEGMFAWPLSCISPLRPFTDTITPTM